MFLVLGGGALLDPTEDGFEGREVASRFGADLQSPVGSDRLGDGVDGVRGGRWGEEFGQFEIGLTVLGHLGCVKAGNTRDMSIDVLGKGLPMSKFIRLNRSVIVNLTAITSIQKAGRGEYSAILKDGKSLVVTCGLRELQERMN